MKRWSCCLEGKDMNHNKRHGHTSMKYSSPTYKTWDSMKQRCANPNVEYFPRYGGRGIKVCERWIKFDNFLADMGDRPVGKNIERINNDGNYEPGNCRWATPKAVVVHGHNINGGTPTYKSWKYMWRRCRNPKYPDFHRYGGRGVSVCERWKSFANFLADMRERPEGKTLDRINGNGNYEPSNCRWATLLEQNQNSAAAKQITINGRTQCIAAWAREAGLSHSTLARRIKIGWSDDQLLRRIRT